MQLTPVYDDPSFLLLEVPRGDPAVPLLRQRRRLAGILDGLDDDQWASPSRCDGWSVQDVIAHLVGTNQFWAFSIRGALAGAPTRFLATFDPVASPAALVDAARAQGWTEVRDSFVETTEALADATAGLRDGDWSAVGEAPPGHVALRAVAAHALWDAWIHERDILLPLGITPVEEPDEIEVSLCYAACLSPAFAVANGAAGPGAIVVEATDPAVRVVVEVGRSVVVRAGDAPADALHLTGPAVELLEALSIRAPLPCPVADRHRWLLSGLARAFDHPPDPADAPPPTPSPT